MSNSWDNYYTNYQDWDEAHRFIVRIELKYENKLKSLGYTEFLQVDDFYLPDKKLSSSILPQSKTYIKSKNEITLSFEVPYDWSIDIDWEDKALSLLGLLEEWVIDSSVEDK